MQYQKGDIVQVSTAGAETIGLINQIDDGILLVGSRWYFMDDCEIKVFHRGS